VAGGLTPVSRLGLFRRKRQRNVAGNQSREPLLRPLGDQLDLKLRRALSE
jgi:hypothetical protein